MASIVVKATGANLTANGTNTGYATVASNADFYPGATAWISSSTQASRQCLITDLVGTTQIGVRFIDTVSDGSQPKSPRYPDYGHSNIATFLLADSARIDQESSVVPLQSVSTIVKKDSV